VIRAGMREYYIDLGVSRYNSTFAKWNEVTKASGITK
jgi:hypothetical protein